MQVIALDEECTPHNLMAIEGSRTTFAVICATNVLQVASINTSNLQVSLNGLLDAVDNETEAVFITKGPALLGIVTYIGDNMLQLYRDNQLTPQPFELPYNINCTNQPTLSPLITREAFLMHCMSESGPTLYVVPVPVSPDKTAQTILVDGVPHSSLDGTYILVVDGTELTVYSSANTRIPVSQKRFPSQIKSVANLDNENVRLLTENGEHVVMNLKDTLAEPRYMPGGTPTLSEWVDSSNHYIYFTEDGTLYVINETSTHPLYELENAMNRPIEIVLFFEGSSPTEASVSSDNPSPDTPKHDGTDVGQFILYYGLFGGILFMILFLGLCCCWWTCCCGRLFYIIAKECGQTLKAVRRKRKKSRQEEDGNDGRSGAAELDTVSTDHKAYEMEPAPESATTSEGDDVVSITDKARPGEQENYDTSEADTSLLLHGDLEIR